MNGAAAGRSAFGPGEQSTFVVSWFGVPAGKAVLTVGSPTSRDGLDVWPIVVLAQSTSVAALYPINDKYVSYWEPLSRLNSGSEFWADEGRKRRHQQVRFVRQTGLATVRTVRESSEPVERTYAVESGTCDLAAAAFSLRNRSFEPGARYEIPVFTGDRTFLMTATVEGTETMKSALGTQNVYRVHLGADFSGKLATRGGLSAYFTTDPSHILVRLQAEFLLGKVVANLTAYQLGTTVELPPRASAAWRLR
jgi:hypothetical protein